MVIAKLEEPQPLARISGQAKESASGGAEMFYTLASSTTLDTE
jgi:hypothetical protein